MTTAIKFNGTHADVRRVARSLALLLAGREPDTQQISRGFLLAIGFAALSDIKRAFIVKSRGGTDEMGIKWPRLSKKYLAYGRRFGKGEQAGLKAAAGLGKGNRLAPGTNKGLLTRDQLTLWRKIYSQVLNRSLVTMPEAAAKGKAAAIAWTKLKEMGAKTKLEVYGNRQVEILRDTGVLFNTLSPGVLSGNNYAKPHADQIFDVGAGSIIIGTNHQFAAVHNFGSVARNIPRRQFLPDSDSQIPDSWWSRWLGVSMKALELGSAELFRRGAV